MYEGAEQLGRDEFLVGLSRTLPRLQAAGANLPSVEPVLDHPIIPDPERRGSPEAVLAFLREIDLTPTQVRLHEHVGGCKSLTATPDFIFDDLDDIYHDVAEGFDIIAAGFPEIEAVWHWRFCTGRIGVSMSRRCSDRSTTTLPRTSR